MAAFKDKSGRLFELKVSIAVLVAAKRQDQIELVADFFAGKLGEPDKLAGALWHTAGGEANTHKLTWDQFCEGLDGDALDAGRDALAEAIIAFQPVAKRDGIRRAWKAYLAAMEAEFTAGIEAAEAEANKVLEKKGKANIADIFTATSPTAAAIKIAQSIATKATTQE